MRSNLPPIAAVIVVNLRPFFRKTLAFAAVVALLVMRLSTFTDEYFVTPVEDAIFDIAFIAEDSPGEGKAPKVKPKNIFDFVLPPVEVVQTEVALPASPLTPTVCILCLKDVVPSIFIPPETLS